MVSRPPGTCRDCVHREHCAAVGECQPYVIWGIAGPVPRHPVSVFPVILDDTNPGTPR